MKKTNIAELLNKKKIVFFVILAFAWIQFSSADENSLNYFEDLDKDGLNNQEEEALGTDPNNADTDGDGYSDGVELESGFDPLVKNEGGEKENTTTFITNSDEIIGSAEDVAPETTNVQGEELNATEVFIENIKELKEEELELLNQASVDEEILETIEATGDDSKYSLTEEEVQAIVEKTIQEVSLGEELEVISEEELNIQEEVTEKNDQTLEEEKKDVEEYFVQVGYIMFEEAPFLFQDSGNVMGITTALIAGVGSDIEGGDASNITDLKGKSGAIYEKVKDLEVPYVLKDVHKMGLSLQKYMLGQDEEIVTDKDDPVALTSILGKVQAVMSEVDILGADTTDILDQFEIDSFDISGMTNTVNMEDMLNQASMYGL